MLEPTPQFATRTIVVDVLNVWEHFPPPPAATIRKTLWPEPGAHPKEITRSLTTYDNEKVTLK